MTIIQKKVLPKLVASDIGGTLIKGHDIIPEFTVETLNRIMERGIPVALVTGYNYETTLRYTRRLHPDIYLMPQNGAICIRGAEKIWEYELSGNEAREIYHFLRKSEAPVIIYKGKSGGFKNYFSASPDFSLSGPFERLPEVLDFSNITGISTLISNDRIPHLRPVLEEMIRGRYQLAYSHHETASWLEVLQLDVRKDIALKRLCHSLNIDSTGVIYFGDNFNDTEALRFAGTPILVENAADELKKEFSMVIGRAEDEGVACYLNELFQLGQHNG